MLDAGSKLFSDKKFNIAKEADYRCAVKEAMRLVAGTGIAITLGLTGGVTLPMAAGWILLPPAATYTGWLWMFGPEFSK